MNIDNFTAYGRFMYNLCDKWGLFICKHKFLYIFLQCTWGIIMTLIGFLAWCICSIFGKPELFYWCPCCKIQSYWGGVELGAFFIRDTTSTESVSNHELGHCIAQNTLLGPFFIFLVGIPSAIRYWYRELKYYRKGLEPSKAYDSVWFEASASDTGHKIVEYFNNKLKAKT